jgi:hypothetical protein
MNSLLRVALVLALLGVGVGPALAAQHDGQEAAVGRIVDIDANHGYVIAEFPNGRKFVSMDKRDMGKYIVGDDLRIDSFGRPLPPKPRSPPPPR